MEKSFSRIPFKVGKTYCPRFNEQQDWNLQFGEMKKTQSTGNSFFLFCYYEIIIFEKKIHAVLLSDTARDCNEVSIQISSYIWVHIHF